MDKLKRLIILILHLRVFWKMELSKRKESKAPLTLQSLFHGFLSVSPLLYDFSKNNSSEYISDWVRVHKASRINDRRKIVLDNKFIFNQLNKNNEFVKPIIAITIGKNIYVYPSRKEIIGEENFKNFVCQYEHGLIIKPYTGGGGARISKVVGNNDTLVFEGEWKSYADFLKYLSKGKVDFLMTEIIKQTGPLKDIYPKTLNTIRILTMHNYSNNKPFIASAVQRIGTDKSSIVDNFTAGGISATINIETGVIGEGAFYSRDKRKLNWFKEHPDTNQVFYGIKINQWEKIKSYVLQQSEKYFYLPYIGWDVVPMESGFFILEGNTNSDVNLLQIHGGLLKDKRIEKFYKDYKAI